MNHKNDGECYASRWENEDTTINLDDETLSGKVILVLDELYQSTTHLLLTCFTIPLCLLYVCFTLVLHLLCIFFTFFFASVILVVYTKSA